MISGRSLRNTDLSVKYFSVNNLRVQPAVTEALRSCLQFATHVSAQSIGVQALKSEVSTMAQLKTPKHFKVHENATAGAKALSIYLELTRP